MPDRKTYEQYTVEEFKAHLDKDFEYFKQNMEHLKVKPQSFPEWYEMFGAWLEVGTDVEEMSYGREVCPKF